MTKVDPVGKGSDHIEGESIEQAERHLSVTVTARSILDGNDAAKEKEDNCQVSKSLFREAAEGRDDDPDVSTKEGKKNAAVISRMPSCFCLLAVAEESVEGGTVDHAHLVGEQLETSCSQVKLVSQVVLMPEAVVEEQPEEEKKAEQVSPDINSLIVYLEDASQTGCIAKGLSVATCDSNLSVVSRGFLGSHKKSLKVFTSWLLLLHILLFSLNFSLIDSLWSSVAFFCHSFQ